LWLSGSSIDDGYSASHIDVVRPQTAPEVRGDFLSIISLAKGASTQRVDAERLSSQAIAGFLLTVGSLPMASAIGVCFRPPAASPSASRASGAGTDNPIL
jgi:hypothetical protein